MDKTIECPICHAKWETNLDSYDSLQGHIEICHPYLLVDNEEQEERKAYKKAYGIDYSDYQ